jgi:hypothetical protein
MSATATTVQPLTSRAETIALIAHLSGVMDELLKAIETETELVRAGNVIEASRLAAAKADLAQQYMADASRLKAYQDFVSQVAGSELEALRNRHDLFHALLQVNMTVLATAHAVSEGIMRGVHDELARKAAPQTYGASGRTMAPPASAAQPLTLSRVL